AVSSRRDGTRARRVKCNFEYALPVMPIVGTKCLAIRIVGSASFDKRAHAKISGLRSKRPAIEIRAVSGNCLEFFAGAGIPELHHVIFASARKNRSREIKRKILNSALMPARFEKLRSRF